LYELFGESRRILRAYGPSVAKPDKKSMLSFGIIAVSVLNVWLRPFLAKWHPRLSDHEARRAAGISSHAHEQGWSEVPALRADLEGLRRKLVSYADLLATASQVPPLHPAEESR
jgi:hypothetical protein